MRNIQDQQIKSLIKPKIQSKVAVEKLIRKTVLLYEEGEEKQ